MIDPYRDIGNAFCFKFPYSHNDDYIDLDQKIGQMVSDKRCKGIWMEAEEGYVYLILFQTWQPKARDLFYALEGNHFHKMDCFTLAYMFEALGIELRKDVVLYDCSRMHNNYDLMA